MNELSHNDIMRKAHAEAEKPWPSDYTPTDWVRSVVGMKFRSFGEIYTCTAYDPRSGFWMESESRVTNVAERAIDRTFHPIRTPFPSTAAQP